MQALSINNLTKVYNNQITALKNISLSVEKGDFFALLGPNGAGKSTTIGIISSLVNKTSGQVQVFGHDLDTQLQLAKSCIGLVPQEFNFNIFEKVFDIIVNQAGFYGVKRQTAAKNAEYYLKKLGLWEKRSTPAMRLSGGMKRRLMIARALVHEPRLLILDEPTAGVDIEIRRSMWDFLREINQKGITIILTTHYLEEAEMLCKNIAIIDKGSIIENSSMKNLLTKLNLETIVFYLQESLNLLPAQNLFPMRLIDEHTIEVDIRKGQSLNDLFELFRHHNIAIAGMRNKTNRLEELFLNLISDNNEPINV